VCVLLQALEGFDILVMSVIGLPVKQEFRLSQPDLGLIFSAALGGMMLGALSLSGLADIYGRRIVIILCMTVATIGILLASFGHGRDPLIACRFLTGLGVGAAMPVINTAVAELATVSSRNLMITISAVGYPLGGMVAGLLGAAWLHTHTWRSLLWISCAFGVVAIVLVTFCLPESASFLLARRPSNTLERINRSRSRLGEPPLTALPARTVEESLGIRALLTAQRAKPLIVYSLGTFCVQFSFYFFLSWLPSLLEQQSHGSAVSGSIMLNVGGIFGDILFALLCLRYGVWTLGSLLMSGAFVAVVGLVLAGNSGVPVLLLSLVIGAALFGSMASVYAMAPSVFPPSMRSSGTGVAFSMGRFGGTLSPWLGALAISAPGLGASVALPMMALPLLGATGLFLMVRKQGG
jgi:MFS family permease